MVFRRWFVLLGLLALFGAAPSDARPAHAAAAHASACADPPSLTSLINQVAAGSTGACLSFSLSTPPVVARTYDSGFPGKPRH
jgi:hypothetical protein